ncbi:MAG TPA: S41 family peptidase, partial [Chthonomonadaceae bacterium]|nr:S41 family peptidase [Chthonomonadaceae bacterium]
KDYGIGTILGERTFGKGLVQSLFQLGDNSALRLTTAKYYTPKHTDINRKRDEDGDPIPGSGGIVPDIEVKQSPDWKAEDFKDKTHDLQLQKALAFLRARLSGKTLAQATQEVTRN